MSPRSFPPPTWVCDDFKRAVWPFVWKSKSEMVSRQRCCLPASSGGLNIVDFQTKCASLRVSSFKSYRDEFGTCKWHYMARYFLGTRLAKLDKRLDFSSNAVPPLGDAF